MTVNRKVKKAAMTGVAKTRALRAQGGSLAASDSRHGRLTLVGLGWSCASRGFSPLADPVAMVRVFDERPRGGPMYLWCVVGNVEMKQERGLHDQGGEEVGNLRVDRGSGARAGSRDIGLIA